MRERECEQPRSELGGDANAIACMKKLTIAEVGGSWLWRNRGARKLSQQAVQTSEIQDELRKLDNGVTKMFLESMFLETPWIFCDKSDVRKGLPSYYCTVPFGKSSDRHFGPLCFLSKMSNKVEIHVFLNQHSMCYTLPPCIPNFIEKKSNLYFW